MAKTIFYDDALDLISKELKQIKNLKAFCKEHKLNYTIAELIKNNKPKPSTYAKFVEEFLSLSGYAVEKSIAYKITIKPRKDHLKDWK